MSIETWVQDTPGISDYWPLENYHPGAAVGSLMYVDGVEGMGAKSLSGNSGFAVAPSLNRTSRTFSIAMWVLPGEGGGTVFQWGRSPGVEITLTPGGSGMVTVGGAARMSNGRFALNHREAVQADQWSLVVLTSRATTIWGGIEARMYVNGSRVAQGSYGGGLFDGVNMNRTNPLTVLAGGADASVDEIVLSDREWTGVQVSALWDAGKSGISQMRDGWGICF